MARAARTFSRLLLAATLIVVGAAMLVLPGPGILSIALGLGIAGRELRWDWTLRMEQRLRGMVARWTGGEAARQAAMAEA